MVGNDLVIEESIEVSGKKNLRNDIEDETLDVDEIVNIKESKNRPLDNVIGNLNKRTLRSQAQDKSNFFCFISTIETKIASEALKDKSWVFRNKLDEIGIVSRHKARLVSQGYNQQEGIDYDETLTLAQPYLYPSPSKQFLKPKAKPFPPCTYCGFNDHRSDYCRMYSECEICGNNDHATSRHNRVILVRGGVLAESSLSSESSIGVSCNTCGSTVHSTTDYSDFKHIKRGEKTLGY
ncbi:retrovirus-related pol polyprotein from transposon TNT 1-94 [Tanacetum coccineum]